MSVVPTTNPLYNYSNFLNTAFAIVQNGTFLKITFAAPISQSFQLNEKLFNIKYSDLGANFVDLGEFDWGILTVNYALCTAPVAGSRQAWIDAVIALITNNGGGSSFINSLGAGNYLTDTYVGYNKTTKQLTDLGTRVYFYATKTSAQVFNGTPSNVLFNVVNSDTASGYNAGTGLYTISQAGDYTISYAGSCLTTTTYIITINGAGRSVDSSLRSTRTVTISLAVGDTVSLQAAGGPSNANVAFSYDWYFSIVKVLT
jgi:hypothetical protein